MWRISQHYSETPSICEYERTSIGGQSGVITVDEFTRQILQINDFLRNELVNSLRNVISEESEGIEKRILENISRILDRKIRSTPELESLNVPRDSSNRVSIFWDFISFGKVFFTGIS